MIPNHIAQYAPMNLIVKLQVDLPSGACGEIVEQLRAAKPHSILLEAGQASPSECSGVPTRT